MAAEAAPNTSILAALRAATSPAHEELDRRLGFDAETLTRARYVTFLRASSAVVVPIEARLARWLPPADDVSRAAALRSDLADLGSSEAPPVAVPTLSSLAEAMGASYVVEGSALGGAVLARIVATALGAETPRRYLSLRGEKTGAHWREVVAALEKWGADASLEGRARACATASGTFAAYSAAFTEARALA